ncbi:exostosin family-domain-containing protein [Hyaloraphidium curvatum]|nr:exostosin family-domain-containing protein [Hyaloraphidium curvatum]KAI9018236.1 exostosin family-domain-containing protein [Hyaloraphidium curvatum]
MQIFWLWQGSRPLSAAAVLLASTMLLAWSWSWSRTGGREGPRRFSVLADPSLAASYAAFVRTADEADGTTISQYSLNIGFEDSVRRSTAFVADPAAADAVVVALYPIALGLHRHMEGNLMRTMETVAKRLVPAIRSLPSRTVLIFVITHVDELPEINRYILRRVREVHPRRILLIRTDVGDTSCSCYGRPYYVPGIENLMAPYAVAKPRALVSAAERGSLDRPRNLTVFFRGRSPGVRRKLADSIRALKRPDVLYDLVSDAGADRARHADYLDKALSSKFCLVPDGDVSSSLRLFESIVARCVPVIFSDCPDLLPFDGTPEVGNYSAFSLIVPLASSGSAVMSRIDAAVASGAYQRMLARLDEVWIHFTAPRVPIPGQAGAHALLLRLASEAMDRMDAGLPTKWSRYDEKRLSRCVNMYGDAWLRAWRRGEVGGK